MLTREQDFTLFGYGANHEVIHHSVGQVSFNLDNNVAKLLHCIAYGDLQSAKALLDVYPHLVLHPGNVETPSGLQVTGTTPLECALGAGDPEMAKMIAPYFEKVDGGAAIRDTLYTKYRTHIENILTQATYDFTWLLDILKQASAEDVAAALKNDMTHVSALSDALEKFRKDFTPDKIGVGMHFNYQHLMHAYEVYDQNYDNFYKSGGNDYDKLRLFCRQIIGFIQRSLPAVDRMVFAQGLYDVVENKVEIERSFKFKYDNSDFPVTAGGSSHSGLGFEHFVGTRGVKGLLGESSGVTRLKDFCRAKISDLQHICAPHFEMRNHPFV